jgi:hypothetical protein
LRAAPDEAPPNCIDTEGEISEVEAESGLLRLRLAAMQAELCIREETMARPPSAAAPVEITQLQSLLKAVQHHCDVSDENVANEMAELDEKLKQMIGML